ncbi:MAG: DUF4349 domain-containing protein [Oscillibacter sp.]|nr:DUF4349 domain-containing protein [Oscillibacter sp.]
MKRKFAALVFAVLLLLTALTACGGSSGGNYAASRSYDEAMPMEEPMWEADDYDSYYGGNDYGYHVAGTIIDNAKSAAAPEAIGPTPSPSTEARPQKLIRTAELTMETTTFQETADALADLTNRLGGYFADSTSGERGESGRWANYTIRVPVNNFQTFLDQASKLCHETRHHISQQDISERYYDTAGRLKTQNIKLQRLQALLEKATSMEDIITIQSAISETEQAIDDLSGTLRHYDNQVDYSTIQVSLEEVYRFSNVPETPKSYGSLLASAFVEGLTDFAEWLEDITVSLAYSWPWLALIAIIVVIVVKINRRRREKRQGGAPRPVHLPKIGIGLKKQEKQPKEPVTGNPEPPMKEQNTPEQK